MPESKNGGLNIGWLLIGKSISATISGRSQYCWKCDLYHVLGQYCPARNEICNKCKLKGHPDRQCPEDKDVLNTIQHLCWRCGTIHVFRNCPAWRSVCNTCQGRNHYTGRCREYIQVHSNPEIPEEEPKDDDTIKSNSRRDAQQRVQVQMSDWEYILPLEPISSHTSSEGKQHQIRRDDTGNTLNVNADIRNQGRNAEQTTVQIDRSILNRWHSEDAQVQSHIEHPKCRRCGDNHQTHKCLLQLRDEEVNCLNTTRGTYWITGIVLTALVIFVITIFFALLH